jgi:hypothetical protein
MEGETLLLRAAALRQPGMFQIEAAIQSAHAPRAFIGQTPRRAIVQLYGALALHFPNIGAQVGHRPSRWPRQVTPLRASRSSKGCPPVPWRVASPTGLHIPTCCRSLALRIGPRNRSNAPSA